MGTRDYARADRTEQRQEAARQLDVDAAVAYFETNGEWPAEPEPSRVITEWSRKSRGRMVRRLCELNYAPLFADDQGQRHGRLPAMVTLTYPGDWMACVPTGRHLKAHLRAFRERYRRAWGEDLACLWKLEFQGRGAPHVHMLCTPPHGHDQRTGLPFRQWLSRTWADVVDAQDPDERARHEVAGTGVDYAEGLRASDPRRVSAYFLGHNTSGPGGKEYQHRVPEQWQEPGAGPGRFWGYWVLRPVTAIVEVTPDTAVAAARVMRRWSRAQGRIRVVTRPRVEGGQPVNRDAVVEGLTGAQMMREPRRVRYRKTRVRAVLLPKSRGWIAVNDGPAFAADLARYLMTLTGDG
ncbi:MAG: helitron helicase-like domain-containing protein [Pseudonocardia sp.]|nr:helitron helicase-like domain-containing protein [Pseudonocardia sp.]